MAVEVAAVVRKKGVKGIKGMTTVLEHYTGALLQQSCERGEKELEKTYDRYHQCMQGL